jgi:hypothetical protein
LTGREGLKEFLIKSTVIAPKADKKKKKVPDQNSALRDLLNKLK